MSTSVALSSITDTLHAWGDQDEVDIVAPTLHGRDKEKLQLFQALAGVMQTKKASTVIIHGESGSGKTSLVDTLRETVCEMNGFFCAGKYFQNVGLQEPYSAIMAAFSDLCDLVIQSDQFTAQRRSEIQRDLGTDGRLLAKAVTSISPFLAASGNDNFDLRNDKAFAKFKIACRTFLHAMSCEKHPIVMFIDDVQWMDKGSRKLVELLLRDTDLKNVLMVFVYRDEEVETVADCFTEDLKQTGVVDIPLRCLTSSSIFDFVCQEMGSSEEKNRTLSDIVWQKTRGNPFHAMQFMDIIQRENLLTFNADHQTWSFDVNVIQREVMVSESLADLLLRKIRRLPIKVQDTLQVASLFGFRFESDIVVSATWRAQQQRQLGRIDLDVDVGSEGSTAVTTSCLESSVKAGFIEKTDDGYQFSHDKLQAAFQTMLPKRDEERLRFAIGQECLAKTGDLHIYHAAVQFNRSLSLALRSMERTELARINLTAAKYCQAMSAFPDAAEFISRGLELIDPNEKWQRHFELTFEMTALLAQMEFIIGNFHECKELTREALRHGRSVEMKVDLLLLDVELQMAGNVTKKPIEAANKCLAVLGVKMPRKVRTRHVVFKLLKVRRMIGRKTDDDILNLQPIEDRAMETAVRLLVNMCFYCFLQDEESHAVYAALLGLEVTLKYGLSPCSSSALIVYGVIERLSGKVDHGFRFGKLGVELLDRIKSKDSECPALVLWTNSLAHCKEPMHSLEANANLAVDSGLECGDVVYSCFAMLVSHSLNYHGGSNLQDLKEVMQVDYKRVYDMSDDVSLMWVKPQMQLVYNIQSDTTNWHDLTNATGEIMDEASFMRKATEVNADIHLFIVWYVKSMLTFFFGFYEMAESCYRQMDGLNESFFHSSASYTWYQLGALIHYERYRITGH